MGVSIHHIDLAVSDVERSLAFYLGLLGPFGMREAGRFPTYRGTEEVVYLAFGDQYLGLRQADGGEYRYYDVGMEHLAFYVEKREDVDAAHRHALDMGMRIHFRQRRTRTSPASTRCSCSIPTACASRWRMARPSSIRFGKPWPA
jgi:catechol 2,3-dioxygenase-like lactoylglutathione lyase family enzyme